MATVVSESIEAAAAQAAGASVATKQKIVRSELSSAMLGAVKGWGYREPIRGARPIKGTSAFAGGARELSQKKELKKAAQAERALRDAVRTSERNPDGVIKGLNPNFVENFPLFGQALYPQNPAISQLQAQMQELFGELGKNFTVGGGSTGTPVASGLVPFDLEAPSHLVYWFDCPLRAKLPRFPMRGISHRTKVITAITGSQTSASAPIVDPSLTEVTSFNTWPSTNLGANGAQVGVDVNIAAKFIGMNENLSWLAQFSGVGFEDISALTNLILMHEMYFAEEYLNIAGATTPLTAPAAVSASAAASGSGQTAITGLTTATGYFWGVSACNYYGETVATWSTSSTWATGDVENIVITPAANSGAMQYKLYVSTTGAAGSGHLVAQFGGTKYTVQGAVSLTAAADHTADSGTGKASRWDGLLSVLSGQAQANSGTSGYPAGFQGGYFNPNAGTQLQLATLTPAFKQLYDGSSAFGAGNGAFRASPEELIVEGFDSANLSADVATNGGSSLPYQLLVEQGDMAGILHGTAVSQITNPITRKIVNVTVHPGWLQGSALLMQWSTPQAVRNPNTFELRMVQDLLSIAWPVIDPTYRYSMFEYGTLFAQAPQYCGLIAGLQAAVTNSGTTFA